MSNITIRLVPLTLALLLGVSAGWASGVEPEPPDDPTLCGGRPVPGSYAWIEPFRPGLLTGIVLSIAMPTREEALAEFCQRARARTIGWADLARFEMCL